MGDFNFVETVKDLWLKPFVDVFAATWAGSLSAIQAFVERDEEAAYRSDSSPFGEGNTALHYAAARGHSDIVDYLLSKRANPNAINERGVNALFLAVQSQHVEIVELLISKSDLCLIEKKSNLTIGSLCAPFLEEEDGINDEECEAKNEGIRNLLLEKCNEFHDTVTAEIARVGATTVGLRWRLPKAQGVSLPITKTVINVYDLSDTGSGESDRPCKSHSIVTTSANASTYQGEFVHKKIIRGLQPRGKFAFSLTVHTALQEGEEGPKTEKVVLIREPERVASLDYTTSLKLDMAKLTWTSPKQNGGAIITGYQIQMRRTSGTTCTVETDMKWYFVRRVPAHIKNVQIPLHEGAKHVYDFRIAAENKLGMGRWVSTVDREVQDTGIYDQNVTDNDNRETEDNHSNGIVQTNINTSTVDDVNKNEEKPRVDASINTSNVNPSEEDKLVEEEQAEINPFLEFMKFDLNGDGFLNKQEFQAWASQESVQLFDSLSYLDICDENGCDDLQGIPPQIFSKLAHEAARRSKNAAEDVAHLALHSNPMDNVNTDNPDDDYDNDSYDNESENNSDKPTGTTATIRNIDAETQARTWFQEFDSDGDGYLQRNEYNAWAVNHGANQFNDLSYSEVCEETYAEEDMGLPVDAFRTVVELFSKLRHEKRI